VTAEHISVNGIKLAYQDHGRGEPVVLLAATGMQPQGWDHLLRPQLLSAGYRTIAPATRGIPPSEEPNEPFGIEMLADDVAGLIRALDAAPAFVVGYSQGGAVAQELARRHPDLMRAAVLAASAGRPSAWSQLLWQAEEQTGPLPAAYQRVYDLLHALPLSVLQNRDDVVEAVHAQIDQPSGLSEQARRAHAAANQEWLLKAADETLWCSLELPCLVVAMSDDLLLSPLQARRAVNAMPHAEYLELDGPHAGLFAQNSAFAAAVLDFLRRCA
jgi:pimeloyl-ACP methyl ester carboxylesterase